MKQIRKIIFVLVTAIITVGTVGFRLVSTQLDNLSQGYGVYLAQNISNVPPKLGQGLNNALIAMNSATPAAILGNGNAPGIGFYNQIDTQNGLYIGPGDGRNHISYQFYSNPMSPAVTQRSTINGSKHREFDIVINTNFNFANANHPNGFYGDLPSESDKENCLDVSTMMLHEEGHLIGMDHVQNSSRLMFESIRFNERKVIDNDYRAGVSCIFSGQACNYNEDLYGNVNLITSHDGFWIFKSKKTLKWNVEDISNSIIGFNILYSKENGNISQLNSKMIPAKKEFNEYTYRLNEKKSRNDKYYVEAVYNSSQRVIESF